MRPEAGSGVAVREYEPATEDRLASTSSRFRPGRAALAAGLAAVSVAAALVGAIGPSEPVRSTYVWPPKTFPDTKPTTVWYTPLVLMRRRPEMVTARFPCSASPALSRAGNPVTVLSTVRNTGNGSGLVVLRDDRTLTVWVDGARLARADLAPGSVDCAYVLRATDEAWSLEGGPGSLALRGSLDSSPTVTGFFSELDLAGLSSPSIEVTTVSYASHPTPRQAIAWALAVLAAIGALLLLAIERRPRFTLERRSFGRCLRQFHPTDAVVGVSLVVWWVLAPIVWDDGWIVARERAYSGSGGFTNYYNALGANTPSDYWLEWLQRWVVEASDALLVWRLPALLSLAVLWVLCRWILRRTLDGSRSENGAVIWGMATAFIGCSVAWGMTVRPEPFTALLAAAVLGCAVTFRRSPANAPLAIAAVLIPLSLAAHHTGIAAIAPVLAVAPSVWRWLRERPAAAVALVLSPTALLAVLTTVGADVAVRLADADATTKFGGSGDHWYQEPLRYERLSWHLYATPPRRGSVALIALVALFFLFRQGRSRGVLDVPARSLLIALPLLLVTWSKLPWHFGVLIGFTAVAVGAEASRLRGHAGRATSLSKRALLFVTALLVACGWAFAIRKYWHPMDLGTLGWKFEFEKNRLLALEVWTSLLPLFVLAILVLVGIRRRERDTIPSLYTAPWRVASCAAPMLMVPAVVFTFIVFTVDMARSTPWTVRRQNLEALAGRASCGIADDVHVTSEAGGVVPLARLIERGSTTTFASPGVLPYVPCARQPVLQGGVAEAPDLMLTSHLDHNPLVYTTSPFRGAFDLYRVRRLPVMGSYPQRALRVFAFDKTIQGGAELRPTQTTVRDADITAAGD